MFRLIFWLMFGRRRPHMDDIQHMSTEKLIQQSMTTLLHARKKEDFLLAMSAINLIVAREDYQRRGQSRDGQPDNVRQLPQQSQQTTQNHNNNQRR
jgi:hypothetical protein